MEKSLKQEIFHTHTYPQKKQRVEKDVVKFPHSPILHYTFSSWIEKTMTKQYIAIGKTDLFYNSMGLCGNFTGARAGVMFF